MSTKRLFIPITKVDAVKGIVYGVAASSAPDRSGEVFDYAGSKPYFEKWSEAVHKATAGKSLGNLRSMHGSVAAGKLEQLAFNDENEQIEVAAKVVDKNELEKVLEGVYTGFSIGGKYVTRKKVGDHTHYVADPHEISLVDLPCIPDATFEVVKNSGTELRKFHVPTVEAAEGAKLPPTNDEVAAEARKLAKAAGSEDRWLEHVEVARKNLTSASGAPEADAAGDLEPTNVLDLAVTAVDEAPAVAKGADDVSLREAVQTWTHPRLPGKSFAKKADIAPALAALDAEEAAAKLAGPVTDALKALTTELDARDPAGAHKNASDNPDYAPDKGTAKKPGAARDPKTAAKDEADKSSMKSADDVMGHAKVLVASPVPSFRERLAVVKGAIEHGCLSLLPADLGVDVDMPPLAKTITPEVAKSANLGSVSELISLVCSLEAFHTRLATGDGYYYYSDATTKVEASPEIVSKISTMVDELGAAAATLLDEILTAMKADDATKAVSVGFAASDLRKIGARNSTADKTRLRKAHDLLAEIEPEMCNHDADKSVGGDLKKALQAQEEAFSKTLGDIADVIKDVSARVKRIEAQPVAGRPSHFQVVEKGHIVHEIIGQGDEVRDANHAAFVEMQGEVNRLSLPRR